MTTWPSPVRHPWYDKHLKRKLSTNNDNQRSTFTYKRRRCDTLERGFAHLTLDNPHLASPVHPPSIFAVAEPRANFDISPSPIVHPSSIEEPQAIPEIKMKNSSWYEPEKDRIVITDLDDSDEEPDPVPDLTISAVLLDRIKALNRPVRLSQQAASNESMALVLFKPVTVEPKVEEVSPPIESLLDDYAMDVEI